MKSFRDESGQTLVLTALCMTILIGCMAVALDVSLLFRAKRKVQIAADAGAIAAGLTYYYGGNSGQITTAAQNAATANGISNVNQVAVNLPPLNGSHTGTSYVEVVITQPNATLFMGAFGSMFGNNSLNPVSVAARAVSGIVPGHTCMYALDPTAKDAFDVQGGAIVDSPNCTIQINSSDNTALCSTGNKATINSDGILIVGAQNPSGKCNKGQPNAQTGVAPVSDPFSSLPSPTCNSGNTFSVGGSNPTIISGTQLKNGAGTIATFTPVTQTTGTSPTQTTASVVCFSDANVRIGSGVTLGASGSNSVFVFQNGVQLTGSATINGTLDLAGGSLDQGNFALTMTAPTTASYTYNGISIFVPATNTTTSCGSSYSSFNGTPAPGGCIQIQFGSSYGNLDGMIYAPAAAVYMQDNGGGTVVTAIIADEIYDKSSNLIITNNYNYVHTSSPLNQVAMVE